MSWRRVLGIIFLAAAFGFLADYVVSNLDELREQRWSVRPGLLLLSIVLHVAGLVWGVAVWRLLIRLLGHDIPLLPLARIWFLSALGRYIPGKVWQFVGAAHIGRGSGLPARVTVTALAAHSLFFFIAALLLSVLLLPAGLGLTRREELIAAAAAPLLLLLLHPSVVRGSLHLLQRVSRKELVEWSGSWADALLIVLLAAANWVVTGTALFLFITSLTSLPGSALLPVIGMNALSFVVGNLVFIAPAGLGAKEGALAVMLSAYLAAPMALVLAIAARLWTIASELLPALILLRGSRDPAPGQESSPETTFR